MPTNNHLAKYRSALEAKLAELVASRSRREEITIEKAPDAVDDLQLTTLRELAISKLNRDFRLLREVRAALARLDEGTYGICLNCEEPIAPRRLEAIPWAAYCVRCQEAIDAGEAEAASDGEFDLLDAGVISEQSK
jgi:DnaK suppressor protein